MPKQVESMEIGTKSHQALKLQQNQLKMERKIVSREKREAQRQRNVWHGCLKFEKEKIEITMNHICNNAKHRQ